MSPYRIICGAKHPAMSRVRCRLKPRHASEHHDPHSPEGPIAWHDDVSLRASILAAVRGAHPAVHEVAASIQSDGVSYVLVSLRWWGCLPLVRRRVARALEQAIAQIVPPDMHIRVSMKRKS